MSETDPAPKIRQFARTQQRVEILLNLTDKVSGDAVIQLLQTPPVKNEQVERIVSLRDPSNQRASKPEVVRQLLKMPLVLIPRDMATLGAWEKAMEKLI